MLLRQTQQKIHNSRNNRSLLKKLCNPFMPFLLRNEKYLICKAISFRQLYTTVFYTAKKNLTDGDHLSEIQQITRL